MFLFLFFKQKTAYDMRISDWSSDVCSSDLKPDFEILLRHRQRRFRRLWLRFVEFIVDCLIERDAVAPDVHEEIAAMRQAVIHLLDCVHDEVDRKSVV